MALGLRAIRGEPVIDKENGEEMMHTQLGVDIALADHPPESAGTLYVTNKQVIWVNVDKSKGYAVDFLSISLHALSTNSEAYYVPCIYTQIETEGDNDNSNSDVQDLSSIREMRLIPIDPTQLDTLFQKFCEGAKLNPDPNHEEACVILFKADQMEDGEAGGNKQELEKMGVEITGNILQGSNGTAIAEGKWNFREIAIKQVPRKNDNHTVREMEFYIKLDNEGGGRIVRCLYTAVTKSHNNLVLEKGICTLNELVHAGLYGQTHHQNKSREAFLKRVSESYHLWGIITDPTIWTHPDSNRKKPKLPVLPSHNLFKIFVRW